MASLLTVREAVVRGREPRPSVRDGATVTKWRVVLEGDPATEGGIPPRLECTVGRDFGPCPEVGTVLSAEVGIFAYKRNDGAVALSYTLEREIPIPGLRAAS